MTKLVYQFPQSLYDNGESVDQVAADLEYKYGLFSEFLERTAAIQASALADAYLKSAMDSFEQNADVEKPVGRVEKIETIFTPFLDLSAIEQNPPSGVPTKRALAGEKTIGGISIVTGVRRPSFVDTGLLRDTFEARLA